MPRDIPSSDHDFEKQQEAIKRKIISAAKSSDSEILKRKAKEEQRDKTEIRSNVQIAHMLVDEGLELYRDGDMSFDEFIEDLHKSLKAISGSKGRSEHGSAHKEE